MARKFKIPFVPNPTAANALSLMNKGGRPFLFVVLDPQSDEPLYEVFLALHMNPESVEERMQKVKTVTQTKGGFIEWHWPDELTSLSCTHSTGSFIGPNVGLTAGTDNTPGRIGRRGTIAWERYQDLLELFRSNGAVYDNSGQPVLRGRIMCVYDRGLFIGYFSTFEVSEDDEHPWVFKLTWEFKIEKVFYRFPSSNIQNSTVGRAKGG